MLQDLKIALRALLRRPVLTAVAGTTLALGIGAVTTVFSLAEAALLRPLPYRDPGRLVVVYDVQPSLAEAPMSYPEYLDWRGQERMFSEVATFVRASYNLTGEGDPERIRVLRASANLLPALGLTPALGRGFEHGEEPPGAARVALISDAMWRSRFGADPEVIGRTLTLDAEPWTVIGILPPETFEGLPRAEVWLPLGLDEEGAPRGMHFLSVLGRLRPGWTLDTARTEAGAIAQRLGEESGSDHGVLLRPLDDVLAEDTAPLLAVLGAAVACVLLIACFNVANLLLARSSERVRELAIRKALGGGRRRLIRQLLTESAVLGLTGAAGGLLLASWGVEALTAAVGGHLPRVDDAGIDLRVLGFTLALSLLTALLFGSVPALRGAAVPPAGALRSGGPGRGSAPRSRLAPALVAAEVALSLVLLTGTGLLVRSLLAALDTDPGFRPHGALALELSLAESRYPEAAQQGAFFAQLIERLERLPGVESAVELSHLPLSGRNTNGGFRVEGLELPEDARPLTEKRLAGPGLFRTLGIPVLHGREFDRRDRPGSAPVALVNQAFAERWLAGSDPIGRRIDFAWNTDGYQEIVGVVGDVRHQGLDSEAKPTIYVPYEQNPETAQAVGRGLVIRTSVDSAEALMPAIREQVFAIDPEQPVGSLATLDRRISESLSLRRLATGLLAALGAVALLLAAIGLYGVLSYLVRQRTQEIGVRMAIGASPRDVLRRVIGRGLALAAIGAAIGLAGSVAATRLLGSLLYGVGPGDPIAFAAAVAVLLAVATIAAALPAQAAARVDPVRALRGE